MSENEEKKVMIGCPDCGATGGGPVQDGQNTGFTWHTCPRCKGNKVIERRPHSSNESCAYCNRVLFDGDEVYAHMVHRKDAHVLIGRYCSMNCLVMVRMK